jgi:hypothetical protein
LPPVPIATFLAGSLLTLLLPIALLIALVAWYWWFSVRVPETADGSTPDPAPAAGNLVPTAPSETSPPTHGV